MGSCGLGRGEDRENDPEWMVALGFHNRYQLLYSLNFRLSWKQLVPGGGAPVRETGWWLPGAPESSDSRGE